MATPLVCASMVESEVGVMGVFKDCGGWRCQWGRCTSSLLHRGMCLFGVCIHLRVVMFDDIFSAWPDWSQDMSATSLWTLVKRKIVTPIDPKVESLAELCYPTMPPPPPVTDQS